jgi:hypothetical protein
MVVLVAGEGQAVALDGVRDEAAHAIVRRRGEGAQHRLHVVAGEVGHETVQARIVVLVEQRADAAHVAEVADELGAPGRSALVRQRRVERVRALVDPAPERVAAAPGERLVQERPVLEGDDVEAGGAAHVVQAREQSIAHHAVEALPVVVDHPPHVPHVVLPALEHRLEDVALVELRVAHQGHHATGRDVVADESLQPHVVLRE